MAQGDLLELKRRLLDEPDLVAALRPILERTDFVAACVAQAAARGLAVTPADVEAALDANRHGWLSHWLPVL